MTKQRPMLWIIAFLILTVSPHLTYLFAQKYIDTENYENRNTEKMPALNADNFEAFPAAFEDYYNDNIPYRNQLIRLNNSIDYFVFQQSSNDKVLLGKDGWLFYTSDGNPVEQSLGYWLFSEEELKTIADNLTVTKEALASREIEFVLFIAPNKETIYTEYLPEEYEKIREETSVDQLVKYLRENTDIRVVYPKEEILEAKEKDPDTLLYYKLDSHWNAIGGYIGAESLARELGVNLEPREKLSITPNGISDGDLSDILHIKIKDGDIEYFLRGEVKAEVISWDFNTEFIYHTEKGRSEKLFVRRDSYGTALAPAIAKCYKDSRFVHKNSFQEQQILNYDADVFVLETVERLVDQLKDFKITFSEEDGTDAE